MALHLQCGNGHQAYVPDCAPECAAIEGAHLHGCPGADLDALLACPPGEGCCELPHNHGAAANACRADHSEAPCPEPATCRPWAHTREHLRAAGIEAARDTLGDHPRIAPLIATASDLVLDVLVPDECPGAHHGLGVRDCTVCRPITITWYAAGQPVMLQPVTGA